MADLFDPPDRPPPAAAEAPRPLADRLRPRRLDEVVGQEHLLGPDGPLGRMLADGSSARSSSGPARRRQDHDRPPARRRHRPRLRPDQRDLHRRRRPEEDLRGRPPAPTNGRGTLLFVDEIHRFNKAQQDAFLPLMEDGTIVLVGATTENPSFELNAALLSRARVLTLRRLDAAALEKARRPRRGRARPPAAAHARGPRHAGRDGRRRRPRALQPRRADRRRDRHPRRRRPRPAPDPPRRALRQVGRRATTT